MHSCFFHFYLLHLIFNVIPNSIGCFVRWLQRVSMFSRSSSHRGHRPGLPVTCCNVVAVRFFASVLFYNPVIAIIPPLWLWGGFITTFLIILCEWCFLLVCFPIMFLVVLLITTTMAPLRAFLVSWWLLGCASDTLFVCVCFQLGLLVERLLVESRLVLPVLDLSRRSPWVLRRLPADLTMICQGCWFW